MPELSVLWFIKISKIWEFHFVFSNILPIEIFLELKKGLSEEFSKTGNRAVFEIKALSQEFSNELLQAYYREAFSEGPCASQGFKSLYQNLNVRAEGNQLIIEGSEAIDKEHFKKIIFLIWQSNSKSLVFQLLYTK